MTDTHLVVDVWNALGNHRVFVHCCARANKRGVTEMILMVAVHGLECAIYSDFVIALPVVFVTVATGVEASLTVGYAVCPRVCVTVIV